MNLQNEKLPSATKKLNNGYAAESEVENLHLK